MHNSKSDNRSRKYEIMLEVGGNSIQMKTFVDNSFGNLLDGLIAELKDLPTGWRSLVKSIQINHTLEGIDKLILRIDGERISTFYYVQEMISRCIFGFLTTLSGCPKGFEEYFSTKINIKYSRLHRDT